MEFAYPKLLLVELIAKIGKEALRKGELPPEALEPSYWRWTWSSSNQTSSI